jgi:hypothetical protein
MKLTDNEIRDITRYLEEGKPLPDKYRFLLFEEKQEVELVWNGKTSEVWIGDYVFENEWQSFRTKKDRSLELKSVFHECMPGRRKIAVKVVDIFGNDTMKVIEVTV